AFVRRILLIAAMRGLLVGGENIRQACVIILSEQLKMSTEPMFNAKVRGEIGRRYCKQRTGGQKSLHENSQDNGREQKGKLDISTSTVIKGMLASDAIKVAREAFALVLESGGVDAIRDAIPQLVQRLDDSDSSVRWAVVDTMEELAKNADLVGPIGNAIPQLIQRLDDSDWFVRSAVARTMGELAKNGVYIPRSGQTHLTCSISRSGWSDWEFDSPAHPAVGRFGLVSNLVGPIGNSIPQLIQRLDDSDSSVREAVVNTMGELARNGVYIPRPGRTHLTCSISQSGWSDWEFDSPACPAVGRFELVSDLDGPIGNAIPQLIQRLEDSDSSVREAVVRTMGELAKNADLDGPIRNAIPQLVQRLDDSDSSVRSAVVRTMGELANNGVYIPMSGRTHLTCSISRSVVRTMGELAKNGVYISMSGRTHLTCSISQSGWSDWECDSPAHPTVGRFGLICSLGGGGYDERTS
ncbi:10777_t:CDS:2, partial [Acaulospora colombiana]